MNDATSATSAPVVISLFSGCGGMDYGFQKEGFSLAYAVEMDIDAADTYRANVSKNAELAMVEDIDPDDAPACDVLLAGIPYGAVSKIGTTEDYFSPLATWVVRKKPKAFLVECAPSVFFHARGRKFQKVLSRLDSMEPSYHVTPVFADYAEYGIPQHRRRLVLVGVRVDTGFQYAPPPRPCNPRWPHSRPYATVRRALRGVENVRSNNQVLKQRESTRRMIQTIPPGGCWRDAQEDVRLQLANAQYRYSLYSRLEWDSPAKTVMGTGGGGSRMVHPEEDRMLTNREMARLQTFPDSFAFCGTIPAVRRQVGLATPPQAARVLAKSLLPIFQGFPQVNVEAPKEAEMKKPWWERIRGYRKH